MSALFKATIHTSDQHTVKVIITTQRTQNDVNGNSRHLVQVWIYRPAHEGTGNLWHPKVKGYRLTKQDAYIIQSNHINEDINYFIKAFEKAVSL